MSRSIFVTTLALVLAATFAFAQQAGQQYGQQQGQSGGSSGAGGSTGAMTMQQRMAAGAQRVATIAEQQNLDLYKAVQAAEQGAKGKAIAAVFVQPQGQAGAGGSAGQGGMSGQAGAGGSTGQQQLNAHVVVATENQLQFVAVDPKANKVLTMQNRPFITNLWQPQGGSSSGMQEQGQGSSGSSMGQSGASGSSGQGGSTGMQGQSDQAGQAGGTTGQQGMLTQDQAQKIYRQVDQQNLDLRKAIQTAESQSQGGKAVAAFFSLQSQAREGMGGSARESARENARESISQGAVYVHVFTVSNNQIKLAILDAKSNKVLSFETRQTITAPWEGGRMGMGGSTGGTSGAGQSGQSDQSPKSDSSPDFPTGSGSGTGPGSLGGSE